MPAVSVPIEPIISVDASFSLLGLSRLSSRGSGSSNSSSSSSSSSSSLSWEDSSCSSFYGAYRGAGVAFSPIGSTSTGGAASGPASAAGAPSVLTSVGGRASGLDTSGGTIVVISTGVFLDIWSRENRVHKSQGTCSAPGSAFGIP